MSRNRVGTSGTSGTGNNTDWKVFFPLHKWTTNINWPFWLGGVVAFTSYCDWPRLLYWSVGTLIWSRIVYFYFGEE